MLFMIIETPLLVSEHELCSDTIGCAQLVEIRVMTREVQLSG